MVIIFLKKKGEEMYLKLIFFLHCLMYIGKPYTWGGNNPIEGMDCSGFAQVVYDAFGVDPPGDQTAHDLYTYYSKYGKNILSTNKSGFPIGAGIYFGTAQKVTHVAISIGFGLMVEAGGGDSTTLTEEDAAKRSAFVRIKKVNYRNDLFAVLMPDGLPWSS